MIADMPLCMPSRFFTITNGGTAENGPPNQQRNNEVTLAAFVYRGLELQGVSERGLLVVKRCGGHGE